MTAFIRPSLILRMDLDERLFSDEQVADIKRSYSYVAPSLVQSHAPADEARVENVMRFLIKLHRPYLGQVQRRRRRVVAGRHAEVAAQHVREGVEHHHGC